MKKLINISKIIFFTGSGMALALIPSVVYLFLMIFLLELNLNVIIKILLEVFTTFVFVGLTMNFARLLSKGKNI